MKVFRAAGKALGCLFLLVLIAVLVTGVSPVYDFPRPTPFSGPDIFDPYAKRDTSEAWKRANFHTHTRVKGPMPWNECAVWPYPTYAAYRKLGYDILTFSNHNELTEHPFDSSLQVNVYEQGYSPFKFHKLVFGSRKVKHFDPLLPLLASQKQWELERLGRGADFVQINHPYRTWGMSRRHMASLSGYELIELDTGIGTENEYWDWALSAGHYSFGLANDDLHKPNQTRRIGVRCNFLQTPSGRYEALKTCLTDGCFYAMRVPDYGRGDWAVKIARNARLPEIRDIGLRDGRIVIRLSEKADSIRVNGQDHAVLARAFDTDRLSYELQATEPYARITAFFPEGEVIYTQPFARYDASAAARPGFAAAPAVNLPLTILWNLLLLLLGAGCVVLLYQLLRK